MRELLLVLQIIISALLLIFILIQTRGTGLGRGFSMGSSQTSFTRRGLEKLVFKATFVLAGLFIVLSILQLFL